LKDVNLSGAKVKGQIFLVGTSFDGKLNADYLQVDGSLLMSPQASFKEVNLRRPVARSRRWKVTRGISKVCVGATARGTKKRRVL
jgi:hypothetical protein